MTPTTEQQILVEVAHEFVSRYGAGTGFTWGVKERLALKPLPRVCFVPLAGKPQRAKKGGSNPRAIFDVGYVFELDCWAADEEAADLLWRRTLRVMHDLLGTGFVPGSFVWQTEKTETASWLTQGAAIRQQVTLESTITEPPLGTAKIATVEQQDGEIDTDPDDYAAAPVFTYPSPDPKEPTP